MRSIRIAAFSIVASFCLATGARAQQPQQQAQPCAEDAQRLCQGIPVGGGAQMDCLKSHKDQLSPACKLKMQKAAEKKEQPKMEGEQLPAPPPAQ